MLDGLPFDAIVIQGLKRQSPMNSILKSSVTRGDRISSRLEEKHYRPFPPSTSQELISKRNQWSVISRVQMESYSQSCGETERVD